MPTLDSMSTSDDAASRLSSALDEVFSKGTPKLPPKGTPASPAMPSRAVPDDEVARADWSVDDESDDEPDDGPDDGPETGEHEIEALALPVIVPATVHPPATPQAPAAQPTIPTIPATPQAPAAKQAPANRTVPPAGRPPRQPTEPTKPTTAPAASAPPRTAPATAWGDHMTGTPTADLGPNLRAPGRRPRVRRVTRVLRHIDPWSTFKVGLLFSVVAYVVALTSGVLLWRVADSTGTLDNVERWFTQFGWETFELKGGEVFHNAWIIGLFGAVALTGGLVLLATLFNLVSDIVGGVRLTVLEEEVVERTVSSTRRYVVRRPPVGGAAPGESVVTDWDVDGDVPAADDAAIDPVSADADRPIVTDDATVDALSADADRPIVADWDVDDDQPVPPTR